MSLLKSTITLVGKCKTVHSVSLLSRWALHVFQKMRHPWTTHTALEQAGMHFCGRSKVKQMR